MDRSTKPRRLDEVLVSRGFFATRSRARDAILRGTVTVEGVAATKPGQAARDDATISVADPARDYVSRAALKLVHGLDTFGFDPRGRLALDIGASTGGFTQVLIQRGALHVIAVDVGHGQMRPDLAADPRITNVEGVNARDLDSATLGGSAPQAIVCDVSFISLRLALPPALALAASGAFAVILIKPQFELGRQAIGKGGIAEGRAAETVAHELGDWLDGNGGWRATGLVESPILGADGNREFLLGGRKER